MSRAARPALLFSLALAALTGCQRRPAIPILGYHAVVPDPGPLEVTPALFAAQLDALAAAGFHPVTLSAALDAAAQRSGAPPLPACPIALTFDDGTADAFTTVLPLLRARGMTATFFVVSSWLATDDAHRRAEPPEPGERSRPVLTWPELRALRAAGMEIGSHSHTHPRLTGLDDAAALLELRGSKAELEAGLGAPVALFAYPYNALRARTAALVGQAGYRAAVAGQAHGDAAPTSLYRIGVYRETSPAELVRFAEAGTR